MRRSAFTLLELIFVIVIIGILAKIGMASIRTDYLLSDANYIAMKLEAARYRGIGYDHRWGKDEDLGEACVTLTESGLGERAEQGSVHYAIHVSLSGELAGQTVCFDRLGQAHDDGNFTSEPIAERKVLVLEDGKGRRRQIVVLPKSGYVAIK